MVAMHLKTFDDLDALSLFPDFRVYYNRGYFFARYGDGQKIESHNVNQSLFKVLDKLGVGIDFDRYIQASDSFVCYRYYKIPPIDLCQRLFTVADALRDRDIRTYKGLRAACTDAGLRFNDSFYRIRCGYWGKELDRKAVIMNGVRYPYFYASNLKYLVHDLDRWRQVIAKAANVDEFIIPNFEVVGAL